VIELALSSLTRMTHRGAQGADTLTGDGSGILTAIPQDFFSTILKQEFAYDLTPTQRVAIAMVFTSSGEEPDLSHQLQALVASSGMRLIGRRTVPILTDVLGQAARHSCPLILQYLLACNQDEEHVLESELYLIRKRLERQIEQIGGTSFICSLSSRTIVYKGLMVADQLPRFYKDLADPHYISNLAIFHERYSTNTSPLWTMAQPFRLLAHNGEINTIKGNRLWMQAREQEWEGDVWADSLDALKPIITAKASDSFSLDNALEFLVHSGYSPAHALMMLIPDPYAEHLKMESSLRDFYIYHENAIEPWDGPAALIITDGSSICAKLDRNGLRPLRYTITKDDLVIMASEAGVVEIEADNLGYHRHMAAGEIFVLSLDGSGIMYNNEIKSRIASQIPYSKMLSKKIRIIKRKTDQEEFKDLNIPEDDENVRKYIALGWDKEDLSRYLIPMSESGRESMGSMGDDTPPAFLSPIPHRLFDYFKHTFAQVTNPPIDPLREQYVTSLFQYLGSETNLLADQPSFDQAIRIEGPVLSPYDLQQIEDQSDWLPQKKILCQASVHGLIEDRLQEINQEGEEAIQNGCKLLLLADDEIGPDALPIPMALAVSSLHHYLIARSIRNKASIICISGEMVEDHHVACLVTLGATAVYPYAAYDQIYTHFSHEDWPVKISRYRYALEKGLLKIMSKSGITVLTSYHGSMLLHSLGLSQQLLSRYFPSIRGIIGGIGLDHIIHDVRTRHTQAFNSIPPQLLEYGRFRYRKEGEPHGFSPSVFRSVQTKAKNLKPVNHNLEVDTPVYLRDLFEIKTGQPVKLEQVENEQNILHRFGAGAMSYGAVSDEVHRALARGFNLVGGRSNTGEGGEQADRFAPTNPDKTVNCAVKQVASGRFGVTTDYLAAAREIQIKISQGAKPGEGGQIAGHKVSIQIANTRGSTPGVPLISPPPHHDIYSIEDIAQLIYDLKQVNPRALVSVKLVSQPGIGTIASGVVKGGADIVLISGGEGGTGASPLGSLKHAGLPTELGLAETHQVLAANGLRSRVTLRADGGLRTGRDVVMVALLGAEEYDFGTSALIALGCVMARQCHLNSCPAGIATQDEDLKKRFKGTPEQLANYLKSVADEVRHILAGMGVRSLQEVIGRGDMLSPNPKHTDLIAERGIDLAALIATAVPADGIPAVKISDKMKTKGEDKHFDEDIIVEARKAILTHRYVIIRRDIRNTDRAVGTRLSGQLALIHGRGDFSGNIQLRLRGVAGQSFGAFLVDGVELRLRGIANDYVGKGMSGGLINIRFEKTIREHHPSHTIIGNVALYGGTGGMALIGGKAGERFAVRNSGVVAVVEGVGNHCCEYMTRGTVLVLGEFGRNFGAGMSGGVAYIRYLQDDELDNLNHDFVRLTNLKTRDENLIRKLLRTHRFHTGSVIARKILSDWDEEKTKLAKLVPRALDILDYEAIYNQHMETRLDVMLNE
jgi:glutamate synthase (NADPH/NADH) large chain/glutamate synthase (ferredoxin)